MPNVNGPQVSRETQVVAVLSRLDKEMSGLVDSVNRLEDRISSSIRPQSPALAAPSAIPEKIRETLVPLAEMLEDLLSRIKAQRIRIDDISDRCEL